MSDASKNEYLAPWSEVVELSAQLSNKLLEKNQKWKGIIAVTRGGLVPASFVARLMDIKYIETICLSSYGFKEQKSIETLKMPDLEDGGEGWLIIDDLVDSGNSFKIVAEHYPNAHLACLYAKPSGEPTCHSFVKRLPQETWIFLPWELDDLKKAGHWAPKL